MKVQSRSGTNKLRNYTIGTSYLLYGCMILFLLGLLLDLQTYTPLTGLFFGVMIAQSAVAAATVHLLIVTETDGKSSPTWLPITLIGLTIVACPLSWLSFVYQPRHSPIVYFMGTAALLVGLLAFTPRFSLLKATLWSIPVAINAGIASGINAHYFGVDSVPAAVREGMVAGFITSVLSLTSMVWSLRILQAVVEQAQVDAVRADLAVAEERLRIARDLHDVFGRTLTAVAVKSELAAEFAEAEGAPRAATESRHVRQLADDALREVRAILAEYRRPDLATELAGARSLLSSASITTRIIGEHTVPDWATESLALVVREGATNLVRHSTATRATFTLSVTDQAAQLTVSNDGVRPQPATTTAGSGIASLRARLESVGGNLIAERNGDTFTVTATVPAPSMKEPS